MTKKKSTISVSAKVSRAECKTLQRIAWEAKRTGGKKLSLNLIMRALIRLMKGIDVDVAGVKSVEELKKRLLEARVR